MHRLSLSRQGHGRWGGTGPHRIRGLRGAGVLIATAGLASIGLAAAPAAPVASAASPSAATVASAATMASAATVASADGAMAAAHPAGAGATSAPGRTAGHRPGPLSAQQPLAAPPAPRLPSGVRRVCPAPARPGQMECMSLVRTNTAHRLGVSPDATVPGYPPAELQSAYNLVTASRTGGTKETVAVVDAYNDGNAVSDLATYRAHFGLPACNASTGAGCVTKVNQQGQPSPLPPGNVKWAAEESIDLDMVSAICPNCHILLVEATTPSLGDLGTADNTAVGMGAKFVSNSWDGVEFPSEGFYDNKYFNHPGVALAVASGDGGYGPGWPSASQFVTSVGGTTLTSGGGARGWTETAWSGTGSGCSAADPKPAWQSDGGCLNRTENDVSAVANPQHGVAVYDTYHAPGWSVYGGTSVATPIITSAYALAGNPAAGTYPASYPYRSGATAGLNDVTSGSNGTCEAGRPYLCQAGAGYDGPTGWGTPNGTAAFASTAAGNVVTIPDPGVQDWEAGTPVFLAVHAVDSTSSPAFTYTASGLPPGLTISSAQGNINGVVTSVTGTYPVTVTATDGSGAKGSVTFSIVVVKSLTTGYAPVSGPVQVDLAGMCMDDAGNATANGTKIQIWKCNGQASQNWTFQPDGNPGGAGTLTIHGKCLDIVNRGTANGTKVQLYTCNGGANQQWVLTGSAGELYNPPPQGSGRCLADPGGTKDGTQLGIYHCNGKPDQAWILPASPVQSGVAGLCMKDPGNSAANGTTIQIWACTGQSSERWTMEPDGTLRINGKCLDVTGRSKLDGAQIDLYTCNTNSKTNANQHWAIGPNGELFNVNSGRCVDDPSDNVTNGTVLLQEDCYGQAGEIWAVT